ncbi:MAG: hypothetical protein AAF958_01420 [Planctomycetota bacterium]
MSRNSRPNRIEITARRRDWLLSLPSPERAKFLPKSRAEGTRCKFCDYPDRAVTSQPWMTWYGPVKCRNCGRVRPGLTKVTRQIDLEWLQRETGLRTEAEYRSALRERDQLIESERAGLVRVTGLRRGKAARGRRINSRDAEEEARTEANPAKRRSG